MEVSFLVWIITHKYFVFYIDFIKLIVLLFMVLIFMFKSIKFIFNIAFYFGFQISLVFRFVKWIIWLLLVWSKSSFDYVLKKIGPRMVSRGTLNYISASWFQIPSLISYCLLLINYGLNNSRSVL